MVPWPDPRDEVLIHDVARDPAAGRRIGNRAMPRRDALLDVGFALLGHAAECPGDAQRMLVVHRNAPLEVIAGEQRIRPQADAAHRPHRIRLAHALADAPVDEAVIELLELQLQMPRRVRPQPIVQPDAPIHVHPLEVQRIDRILLALKPVAGNVREDDLHEAVLPREGLPVGDQRSRLGSQVGPNQAGPGLNRIGLDPDLVLEASLGRGNVLVRLLDAAAVLVEQPAMVVAAQPALFDEAVGCVGAAMRALAVDQPEGAAQILVESQILAQQADRLDGLVFELGHRGYRHPIAAQQFAHRGAGADLREKLVLRAVEHFVDRPPQKFIVSYNCSCLFGT